MYRFKRHFHCAMLIDHNEARYGARFEAGWWVLDELSCIFATKELTGAKW